MNSEAQRPMIRTPDDAPSLEVVGVRVRFLVSGADTDGAWSLIEYTAPANFAGPVIELAKRFDTFSPP